MGNTEYLRVDSEAIFIDGCEVGGRAAAGCPALTERFFQVAGCSLFELLGKRSRPTTPAA
jgi:hypothetical protein